MNVKIIAVGKLKERYWTEAESEYIKRLTPYAKVEIIELPEEAFQSTDEREKIQQKEAEKIKKILPQNGLVLSMHEEGKQMTSRKLAKFLEDNSTRGETIIFLIGGPLGLHQSLLNFSHKQLSLSELTFPHQMVRTILLEQLYRCVTISKGKQYHY